MSNDLGSAGGGAPVGPVARRVPADPPDWLDDADVAPEPLSARELRLSIVRPDLLAANVLGSVDRLAQNLSDGGRLGLLVVVLFGASVATTVPYGAFSPVGSFWKVAVLFTGSLLICLPCLHVVLQFLGFKVTPAVNLSLSLVITATAGLFTLGFFPIMWFIDATTRAGDNASVTPTDLSRVLLGLSLLMGVIQMCRCLTLIRWRPREGGGIAVAIILWIPLVLFIVWRMADVLGLRA